MSFMMSWLPIEMFQSRLTKEKKKRNRRKTNFYFTENRYKTT